MEERKLISEPEAGTVEETVNEVAEGSAAKEQRKGIILNSEVRDSGGKIIFEDNELCAQFVRDYVDLPCLKNVTSEDIEDVSDQFVTLFAEERNADRVKRVRLRNDEKGNNGEETPPFFLVSLIEHKTKVEYNVCMQIFRYMVYIWDAYEKEMEKQKKGISKLKSFRYPPVLPIVYYEGCDEWTAPVDFQSRVNKSDVFGEYIPDFKYYLVPIQKYSNAELLSKEDEISLIMLINKMQTREDVEAFRDVPTDTLQKILKDTPDHIVNIIADILLAFQLKANVPLDLAEANVGKVREKNVARLFENATFGDLYAKSLEVQAQRKQLAELAEEQEQLAKKNEELSEKNEELSEKNEELSEKNEELSEKNEELSEKNEELSEKNEELSEKNEELSEKNEELSEKNEELSEKNEQLAKQKEEAERSCEKGIKIYVELLREISMSYERAYHMLQDKYELAEGEAKQKLDKYWR